MAMVRVLRDFRGAKAGVFADIRGQALKDGLAEGALDDKAQFKSVPDAEKHPAVIGDDGAPASKDPPAPPAPPEK